MLVKFLDFLDSLTVRAFSYSGIPLYLHWSWSLFILLILVQSWISALTILTIFFFVVLHEYGHALTAQKLGVETGPIHLFPFGGAATIKMPPDQPKVEFWVTVMGPMVNLMLGGFFFGLSFLAFVFEQELVAKLFMIPTVINVVLLVFNLIPAFPMDGGRIFRSMLSLITKDYLWSTRVAVRLGQVLSVGFIAWGLYSPNFVMVIAGPFLMIAAEGELAMARVRLSRVQDSIKAGEDKDFQ